MAELEVAVATPAHRVALENLLQLYIHDFSEHWAGRPDGELNDNGRFAAYPLDAYWRERDHVPLLVRVERHLAGFALLNRQSHTGQPVDRNMAEFFVVRKHRRSGIGTVVARTIFDRYPGQWEAAVARRNVVALAFWRRAVGQHESARGVEEIDENSPVWNGPVLRFRVGRS